MDRYIRNQFTLSAEENASLRAMKVCVVGCGGLGGNLIEMLGRLGVGTITAIDGDVFESSNLNRQILSRPGNLGQNKAKAAHERMALVNPDVNVVAVQEFLSDANASELLACHHLILDGLDRIPTRLLLEDHAEALGIPLVHGAVAGWYGQVATVFPGDRTLHRLYPSGAQQGAEKQTGNPSFGPACIAAIQVSEAVKILIGRGEVLRRKLLTVNLLDQEYEVIGLG